MGIQQLLLSSGKPPVRYEYKGSYAGTSISAIPIGTPQAKRIVVCIPSAVRGGGLTNSITACYIDYGGGAVAMNVLYSNGTGNVAGASAQVAMFYLEVPTGTTANFSFSLAAGSNVVQTAMEISVIYDYDNATPILSTNGAAVVNGNATLNQQMDNLKAGSMTIIASNGASDGAYSPTDVTSHYSTMAYGVWSINRQEPADASVNYTLDNARFFLGANWR